MRFLLDVNIPVNMIAMFELDGHTCRHIALMGNATAKDSEITRIAKENDEIIITHDLDFGTILAFSGDSKPSVIIFRIHLVTADIFHNLIQENMNEIETHLINGAIVVFEEENIRIRKLPIVK